MILLSIGYTSMKCDVYSRLSELSAFFKDKGINIGIVESDSGSIHFIKCMIRDEDSSNFNINDLRKSFNVYASNIIYDMIVDSYEADSIIKIVKENYNYFKTDEINDIVQKCLNIISGKSLVSNEDYLLYINRKNVVVNKLMDYMGESTDLVLEGFLTFRLKNLTNELENIIDKVVEEYMIEREYNEFIKLLRYFVEIQESRIDIVNITVNIDGSYCMYDNKFNQIADEMMKELIGEAFDGEKSCDDFLVSSLITIAPRYIVIHNASNIRNKEVVETIKNVFYDRVKVCTGCDFCIKSSRPVHKV